MPPRAAQPWPPKLDIVPRRRDPGAPSDLALFNAKTHLFRLPWRLRIVSRHPWQLAVVGVPAFDRYTAGDLARTYPGTGSHAGRAVRSSGGSRPSATPMSTGWMKAGRAVTVSEADAEAWMLAKARDVAFHVIQGAIQAGGHEALSAKTHDDDRGTSLTRTFDDALGSADAKATAGPASAPSLVPPGCMPPSPALLRKALNYVMDDSVDWTLIVVSREPLRIGIDPGRKLASRYAELVAGSDHTRRSASLEPSS